MSKKKSKKTEETENLEESVEVPEKTGDVVNGGSSSFSYSLTIGSDGIGFLHNPSDLDSNTIHTGTETKVSERASVLEEAKSLIEGDRNVTYGSPTENFQNIGEFWTTRLAHKLKDGQKITGHDVADLMVLLKVARNIAQPKRDNMVDGAGYFACGWEAYVAEQERDSE